MTLLSSVTMSVTHSQGEAEDERFQTALLLVIAQDFGREKLQTRYRSISTLVSLTRSKYESSGIIISSAQAFRVLCQRGVDFRSLID